MISFGSATIQSVFLGSTAIARVYRGTDLVFDAAPPANLAGHRYWRLWASNTVAGAFSDAAGFAEVQFRSTAGVAETNTGGTAFACYSLTDYQAAKAFDGSTTAEWRCANQSVWTPPYWIGYDFGAGAQKTVAEIAIFTMPETTRLLRELHLQYSDDGLTYYDYYANHAPAWTTAAWNVFSVTRPTGLSAGLDPDAEAYIAAMAVTPDAARQTVIDNFVKALKTGGVYAKLDALYLLAAHDVQATRVNLIDRTEAAIYNASYVPTFVADRYSKGNASGTSASIAAYASRHPLNGTRKNFLQNSAHMGLFSRTDLPASTASNAHELGCSNAYIARLGAGGIVIRPNTGSGINHSSVSLAGHVMWNRTAAAAYEVFRNGASVVTGTTASLSVNSASPDLLGNRNYTFGGNNEIVAAHWGGALTAAEITALYNALNTYKTAIGA